MPTSWFLKPGDGIESLTRREEPQASPGPGEVRVSMRAHSLNARDLMIASGQSPLPAAPELTPLSDGAGVVDAVGKGVTRVAVGDRVVVTFNPAHQTGAYEPYMELSALGGVSQGLLRQEAILDQMAVVPLPDSVTFEQAACLPCTGVVAWNALFETASLKPGQTVLATGTGNVSLVAVALARAAGARVGVTSSDEAKLDRARTVGAHFGVNYATHPEWDAKVRGVTLGRGADVVVETAGPPSVATSVRAAAQGGTVAQIGFKGVDGPAVQMFDLLMGGVSLRPVMVGSRAMLERLVAAVAANDVHVPVHSTHGFDEAPDAFHVFMSGESFGKVVIAHGEEL
ncbi:MAG: NAD(P)-dependent alcohol dehydrogenase [Bacteroidota bacterium]